MKPSLKLKDYLKTLNETYDKLQEYKLLGRPFHVNVPLFQGEGTINAHVTKAGLIRFITKNHVDEVVDEFLITPDQGLVLAKYLNFIGEQLDAHLPPAAYSETDSVLLADEL